MLHHLDRGSVTQVNGRQVDWVSINEHDEIAIGPYLLRYESAATVSTNRDRGSDGDNT
jgi:hypothetical protein